jgi:hypothetical protein
MRSNFTYLFYEIKSPFFLSNLLLGRFIPIGHRCLRFRSGCRPRAVPICRVVSIERDGHCERFDPWYHSVLHKSLKF